MPSIPAELHGIIQDNLDVDEAMRLRQSGMNLPLFLTDNTLDQTLQRYETHAAADGVTSQTDLETRTRLYNQHRKGYPCKQIIPDTTNVPVWPENTATVIKGRFYGWESFGHESIRILTIWDMLHGDFYKFPTFGDNIVNFTITNELVGIVTPTTLYTITIQDMVKHRTSDAEHVHKLPRQSLRDRDLPGGALISGENSQLAVFANGEIKLYDYLEDKFTHVASEIDFTSLKQFSTNFVRVPDDASDTSSDMVLENGIIWLVYLKEDSKSCYDENPRSRPIEIHRFSSGEHMSWNLTFNGPPYHSLRNLRMRSTGLTNQWQIQTAKQVILLELSDDCKVVNVLENNGTYVWKDKVYHNIRDTITISQLGPTGKMQHLASIVGRDAYKTSSQSAKVFANEGFMVRSMHYGYFDPHDNSHEIAAFSFDQMAEPKDSFPLTMRKNQGDFHLVKIGNKTNL